MEGFEITCLKCGKKIKLAPCNLYSFAWPSKQEWIDEVKKEHGLIFVGREDDYASIECECGNKIPE